VTRAVSLSLVVAVAACGGGEAARREHADRRAKAMRAVAATIRTVAHVDGIAQCPHALGESGEWLVTRITRNAIAQRMGADGTTLEPVSGLGESETPEGRSSLAYCAVASPDGRKIAYTVTSPSGWYGVEVRGIDGGRAVALGAGVSPAWSADGSKVAFLTFGESEPPAIVIADPASGRRTGSIRAPEGMVPTSPPAFSPDGTQIAFSAGPAEGASELDIWVGPLAGGAARKLTGGGAWNLSPTWSPDGAFVIYSSKREAGSDLFAIPLDGGGALRLVETVEDESDPVAWGAGLRWVAALATTSDIYLYELGGATPRPEMLAETPTEERAGAVTEGHDVIVVRWSDQDSDIWAQPLEGGDAWGLVTGPTRDGFPGVDPAGTIVAFLRSGDETADVWTTPLEDPAPHALTTGGAARDGSTPLPSPDGSKVAYVAIGHDGAKDALVVQPAAGGAVVRVVDEPETYAWDPSGSSLVVSVYEGDEPRLYRVRTDGRGRKERLRGDLEGMTLLGILPGGHDALTLDQSDEPRVMRFDLATGHTSVELTLPGNVDPASVSVATDPDARHIVVAQNLIRSEIREAPDLNALIEAAR
jgi:Tol biopolymer transport system component